MYKWGPVQAPHKALVSLNIRACPWLDGANNGSTRASRASGKRREAWYSGCSCFVARPQQAEHAGQGLGLVYNAILQPRIAKGDRQMADANAAELGRESRGSGRSGNSSGNGNPNPNPNPRSSPKSKSK
ncbi:uncharacterized protein BP5553_02334 [Venustampulla echinocandica]|uniref:Uncharacterized protein n=1 Tax=Venustampulla echinocandica TaxID=2656787 RepID=A0A370U3L1_9HELO|nr:uncharacterized protein BP5553_02334 [Venustampulla echinocandica]RDL42355.1 hypothetical protein BP5553_02334 [Venustampulla echinocandica]